jgi:ribonuclease HI
MGEVMAARSLTKEFRADPTTAEALVALNAILFCKELGLDNVIIEGDAMGVIKAIDIAGPTCSCFGHFIEGIHLAMRGLESVKFAHALRKANHAAHMLAKLATTHVTNSTWLENFPTSICNIVRKEHPFPIV